MVDLPFIRVHVLPACFLHFFEYSEYSGINYHLRTYLHVYKSRSELKSLLLPLFTVNNRASKRAGGRRENG